MLQMKKERNFKEMLLLRCILMRLVEVDAAVAAEEDRVDVVIQEECIMLHLLVAVAVVKVEVLAEEDPVAEDHVEEVLVVEDLVAEELVGIVVVVTEVFIIIAACVIALLWVRIRYDQVY